MDFRRYIKHDLVKWDHAKSTSNKAKHGLAFSEFLEFDGSTVTTEDLRFDYGESRWVTLGRIDGLPHAIVFTRRGVKLRLIGFRRAHEEEISVHE